MTAHVVTCGTALDRRRRASGLKWPIPTVTETAGSAAGSFATFWIIGSIIHHVTGPSCSAAPHPVSHHVTGLLSHGVLTAPHHLRVAVGNGLIRAQARG